MNKTATLLLLCTALFAQQKGTFTDTRDGKIYKTVKIGEQVWMAENLNYEASGSKCYDNKPANCSKYGRLYNWNTAKTACPSGWHLPPDDEWDTLLRYVDCITCPSCFYMPDSSAYIISLCYEFCISETNSIYKITPLVGIFRSCIFRSGTLCTDVQTTQSININIIKATWEVNF